MIANATAKVAELINHQSNPLDILRSAINRPARRACRNISVGQPRSDGQLATAVTWSTTVQDNGAACAANVLAVAIAYDRVTKRNGLICRDRRDVAYNRHLFRIKIAA